LLRVHGSDFSHRHCRSGHLPALQCQHVAAGCAQMAICYGCSNVRLRHMVVQCAMMCFFCTTGRLFKAPASQNFAVPRLLQDLDHSKCLGWRSAASTRPVCNVGYDNASRGGATMPDILQWAMRTSGLITLQLRCTIVSLHSGSSAPVQSALRDLSLTSRKAERRQVHYKPSKKRTAMVLCDGMRCGAIPQGPCKHSRPFAACDARVGLGFVDPEAQLAMQTVVVPGAVALFLLLPHLRCVMLMPAFTCV